MKIRGVAPRHVLAATTAAALLAALGGFAACGTDAVGVGACRQIEEARCRQAPGCGISIEPPYFTSGTAVEACIQYYDTACLHGLEVSPPPAASVDACVAAIQSGCAYVARPQDSPSCAWLAPAADAGSASEAGIDAGADAPGD